MNQKAASLIEIVIGMIILSIIVLGISATMSMVGGSRVSSGPGGLEIQATNYGRQLLENLKNLVSTNSTTNQYLTGSAAGISYNSTSAYSVLPAGNFKTTYNGARSYIVQDVDVNNDGQTDYKKVTATVTWDE